MWDLRCPKGRFMDDPILKNLLLTNFDFHKISEIHEIFRFFYNVHEEKVFTIVIGNGREAPECPLNLKSVTSIDCIFRYYF